MINACNDGNTLKRVQDFSLDILRVIDEICRENGIIYSVAYGTMLGAVRHKGFIPWDDDIDLMMPPEEYDKLLKVCETELPENLKIIHCGNNREYPLNFAKIVNTNTTFVDADYEGLRYCQGVSVDIFPIYRIRNNPRLIRRMKFKNIVNGLLRMAYTGNAAKRYNGFKKILVIFAHWFSRIIGLKKLNGKIIKRMTKEHARGGDRFLVEYGSAKTAPYSLFDDYSEYQFEDMQVCGVADYDEYLKDTFGDYMELPPPGQREAHIDRTIIVDLDKPCEEKTIC